MSADVRSFIADEPNTPRDDDDDTDDEYGEDEEFGVECCAPLLSLTWVSCPNRDTLLKRTIYPIESHIMALEPIQKWLLK